MSIRTLLPALALSFLAACGSDKPAPGGSPSPAAAPPELSMGGDDSMPFEATRPAFTGEELCKLLPLDRVKQLAGNTSADPVETHHKADSHVCRYTAGNRDLVHLLSQDRKKFRVSGCSIEKASGSLAYDVCNGKAVGAYTLHQGRLVRVSLGVLGSPQDRDKLAAVVAALAGG